MSRYDATDDPLCFPNSNVLQNSANIRDQDELDQFEQLMFLTRSEEPLPDGYLDFEHYKAIHHHFFQDVYDWAGQARQVRTAKGQNWFCFPEYIDHQMRSIFRDLKEENHLMDLKDPQEFSSRAAHYVSEINAIHPFREGNGRCQLTLLNILIELAGFELNENHLVPDRFMNAMIISFTGDIIPLASEVLKLITQEPA